MHQDSPSPRNHHQLMGVEVLAEEQKLIVSLVWVHAIDETESVESKVKVVGQQNWAASV